MHYRIYNSIPHLEVPGDKQENQWKYCWKDDTAVRPELTRFEKGERAIQGQGKRNDILKVRDKLKAGAKLMDLIEDDECVGAVARYPKFVQQVRSACLKKKIQSAGWCPKEVYVYWGDTRTGKSRKAHWEAKAKYGEDVYFKSKDKDWFDHYDGEEGLVIDEFYGAEFTPAFMLGLLDGHFFSVNAKGVGAVASNIKTVWITSNVSPDEWWRNADIPKSVRDALRARFTRVEHFDGRFGVWKPPVDEPDVLIPDTPPPVAENQQGEAWYGMTEDDLALFNDDPIETDEEEFETPTPKRKKPSTPPKVSKRKKQTPRKLPMLSPPFDRNGNRRKNH